MRNKPQNIHVDVAHMSNFHSLLATSRLGELTTVGLSGGTWLLAAIEIITPIAGLFGVLIGIVVGIYTIKIKHAELKRLNDHEDAD